MVRGRQKEQWDCFAGLMSFIAARMPFTAEQIDPLKLNPYRRSKIKRTPEQIERDNRFGWRLIETGLGEFAKGNG